MFPLRVRWLLKSWQLWYGIAVPLGLMALPLAIGNPESKCAFVALLMALYWMLEPIPLAATALIPVFAFPLFGILSTAEVCVHYMKDSLMLLIGSLIIATALEKWNLHRRIALKVLLVIGPQPRWLVLSFLSITSFLSMWTSNLATAVMMVAIAESVIDELEEDDEEKKFKNGAPARSPAEQMEKGGDVEGLSAAEHRTIKTSLMLSISYGCGLGSTVTLTGSPPNLVLTGLMPELYPNCTELTFFSWFIFNLPGMIICLILAWIFMQAAMLGCCKQYSPTWTAKVHSIVHRRYKELGSITFPEVTVVVLYLILIFLWFFRDPKFMPGWAALITDDVKIGDASPAILVSLLLFLIPSRPATLEGPPLLDWNTVQAKMPWGVMLLLAGGFALAEGAKKSGLSQYIGQQLAAMPVPHPLFLLVLLCIITASLTEIVTNATAASVLLPLIAQLSNVLKWHPFYLMIPVTVCASYAFMLPVATPPNAVVFESGGLRTIDMVKPGFVMNIICCTVEVFMISTLGTVLFDLDTFPEWAKEVSSNFSTEIPLLEPLL